MGKRSRKQRAAGSASGGGAPAKPRRGPEPKPWPERPSVTRAKNASARERIAGAAREKDAEASERMSRSEARNAAAREKLRPLEEGERPLAVTIGAFVAVALVISNIVVYAAGVTVRGDRPAFVGFLAFCALMASMAWGLWHAKYWAVLGLEALLGILILVVSLVALVAASAADVVICVAIVVPSAALFWFLIRAMARIQMPTRPR